MPGKRVYLASPYSHPDPVIRYARYMDAVEAGAKLMKLGYIVFAPIPHSHEIGLALGPDGSTHDFWMAQDLPWLERCDMVVVLTLPEWDRSRGVGEEIAHAAKAGIPVYYVRGATLESDLEQQLQ